MEPLLPKILIWSAIVIGYVISRAAEFRIHRRNYSRLLASGAEERARGQMRAYYAVQLAVVPVALVEMYFLETSVNRPMLLGGIAAVIMGQMLRLWAIYSLGDAWTMRCIVLPGQRQRRIGPYRVMANPEYCSRIIDGVGICLIFGAKLTLLGFMVVTLVFNRHLAKLEEEQSLEHAAARFQRRRPMPVP